MRVGKFLGIRGWRIGAWIGISDLEDLLRHITDLVMDNKGG
jgi:hypothetical protein